MISLSLHASRYIMSERVPNLYSVEGSRRALLAEVKALTTNEHLSAWKDQTRALVDHLEAELVRDRARVEEFERAIPPLELALRNENEARAELDLAQHLHAAGSLDRKEQLKRRDDVEAASGALTVRIAERVAAVAGVPSLPQGGSVAEGGDREMVEQIANLCLNRRFKPEYPNQISSDRWARLLEVSESELMWIPVHAARAIVASRVGITWTEDAYREQVVLPIDDFVHEMAKFKSEREAHLRRKVAVAQELLESARANAAAFGAS